MTTEYRRGIPSVAHIGAATRLGLLFDDDAPFATTQARRQFSADDAGLFFRPIRSDGAPVDWEVLDAEVARAGQQGQPRGFRADLWRRMCQNFLDRDECDLRLSMVEEFDGDEFFRFSNGNYLSITEDSRPGYTRADILARWTVYQELKPLYDLVDGAQGEAAMPRDVEAEWDRQSLGSAYNYETDGDWVFGRDSLGVFARSAESDVWRADPSGSQASFRNFAAILDAVAERRVAERQAGQTLRQQLAELPQAVQAERAANEARRLQMEARLQPGPLAQPATPEPRRFTDVRPDRHGWRWWRVYGDIGSDARIETRAATGEFLWLHRPGDMWGELDPDFWTDRTVIPTDEQGNPVSWEAAGFAVEAVREAQESVQQAANDATPARSVGDIEWTAAGLPVTRDMTVDPATGVVRSTHAARIRQLDRFVAEAIRTGFSTESPTPPRLGQFSNNPATPPLTSEGFQRVLAGAVIGVDTAKASPITTLPLPLPRFTADELDDVDHSKTTKLDEVTLRRGKLPTVEQIAKYREVRAKRTGGTVADALKESRIDCEVAQYVLERWAGGLGDADTVLLLQAAGCMPVACVPVTPSQSFRRFDTTQGEVDRRSQDFLRTHNPTLDTSEKPSPIVQRERQEAEERRQRLAELRQRLVAERAAQPTEEAPTTTSRFDLIEPDPQADPAASIRAWEARQAAAKVRPVAAPSRIVKPAAAPRRPTIEVVDAEVDGLSRSEVFAALFGRALNEGC